MHTTALDQHSGCNESLKRVSMYVAWLCQAEYCNECSSVVLHFMDPKGMRVTQNTYFSLLRHIKQLLFVTILNTTVGIGNHKV